MAKAISKIYSDVTLVGFKSKTERIKISEIFDRYDVEPTFKLKLLQTPIRGVSLYYLFYTFFLLLFKSRTRHIIYGRETTIIFLANILGFKVMLESHDFFHSKIKRSIEKILFRSKIFLKLVVISESLKVDYLNYFPHLDKIQVQHDAADMIENKNLNHIVTWPSERNTIQIGYFGHLFKGRGIEIILDAAKVLINFDFHIVGGNESDIEKYKNMSLSPNVYFHGFKEQRELSGLRNKCDILLLPYQKKLHVFNFNKSTAKWMSPMKLFEYMSSKKAIISSDLPVLKEVLNSENSILVTPDNVPEWVNAIKKLATEKELRETIAINAYKDFKLKYTWEKRAKNIFNNIS
jgi:glycosyltransferase involved in cell wall biosynthesis